MADYFGGEAAPAADVAAVASNGVAPASGGDVGMDDEIMVCIYLYATELANTNVS